jgi:hypothetical protein
MSFVTDDQILAALDKPRKVYSVLQQVDPSNRSEAGVQEQLMRLRAAGKVLFDIKTGRWRRANGT